MSKVFEAGRFKGGYSVDDIDSILENAMKIAKEAVAPTNDDGDTIHAVYKNGKVTVPESFKKSLLDYPGKWSGFEQCRSQRPQLYASVRYGRDQ